MNSRKPLYLPLALIAFGMAMALATAGIWTAPAQVMANENTPATGAPTINGTVKVGQTLTVDTSGIADDNGLDGVSYTGTWYASEPGSDSSSGTSRRVNLAGSELKYKVSRQDVGMVLTFTATFADDAGNLETLSAETGIVQATTPAAPTGFAATPGGLGATQVFVYWHEPVWRVAFEPLAEEGWGDGGSPIMDHVVQWKEADRSWDDAAHVFESPVIDRNYFTGSVGGYFMGFVEGGRRYAARVIAINAVGHGTPSNEATYTGNTPATGAPVIEGTASVGKR